MVNLGTRCGAPFAGLETLLSKGWPARAQALREDGPARARDWRRVRPGRRGRGHQLR